MVARARYGTPYVLLIQDLWPDSIFATGFLTGGPLRAVAESVVTAFVDASYRHASHICVISPGMRRTLIERGVPPDKVSVVFNWVDEAVFKPAPRDGALRRRLGLGDEVFVALFAGNAGEAQGLMAWVSAMGLVSHLDHVHLVFLGGGTQRETLRAEAVATERSEHMCTSWIPSQLRTYLPSLRMPMCRSSHWQIAHSSRSRCRAKSRHVSRWPVR